MKLNIETKYNIGDKFWILNKDISEKKVKAVEITVVAIELTINVPHSMTGWVAEKLPDYSIRATYHTDSMHFLDDDDVVYKTKEELLATL